MSSSGLPAPRWYHHPLLHAALLLVVCATLYSNNFRHDFFLDDSHAISNNLALRSLANIPAYFTDAGMFSALRANVDYRPVLLTTYALNYRLGGLEMPWWHATQILLHGIVVLALWLLARRILEQSGMLRGSRRKAEALVWIPLGAALLFAVHPTGSGVVNYISARSSLLTAAFLLPAILLYAAPFASAAASRIPWGAVALYTLALFTKIEALAALGVFVAYEIWKTAAAQKRPRGFLDDAFGSLTRTTLTRLAPFVVVTLVYGLIRMRVMADFAFDETRKSADMTSYHYLLTQTVVWWEYLLKWFAPVGLVADHGSHAVYRSPLETPVLVACLGWLLIAAALFWSWRRAPWLLFVVISAFALLSPTSSIAPLAEMLNEHRPYLPLAILSLAWVLPFGVWVMRQRMPALGGVATVAVIVLFFSLTSHRNVDAFSTDRAYLEDINRKAPSHRSLMNYGLIKMREGRNAEAKALFEQALTYAPAWHFLHVNLGIVNRAMGNATAAQEHFDLAVRYDGYSGVALRWRGDHYRQQGNYAAALADFLAARQISLEHYELCKGLASSYAGLGRVDDALRETEECLRLDAARAAVDIVVIAKPFFDVPSLTAAGMAYFERLESSVPDAWWAPANLAVLARRAGDSAKADAAEQRAARLRGS
jgi:Tfp pilus assembly protein PilF